MLAIRHIPSRAAAGLREPLEPAMRPALGEKAQARPLSAGESSFVADLPRCAREGLAPQNMVSLLASTVIMGDTRDAVVIVPVAYRLLQKPERPIAGLVPGVVSTLARLAQGESGLSGEQEAYSDFAAHSATGEQSQRKCFKVDSRGDDSSVLRLKPQDCEDEVTVRDDEALACRQEVWQGAAPAF